MGNAARKLILASASPRRRALMEEVGYEFEIIVPDVDESLPPEMECGDAAVEIARRKAAAVAAMPRAKGAVVLGADTIVVTPKNEICGKPIDPDDARAMLKRLSDTTHTVITGVCIIDAATGKALSRAVRTAVVFGKMTDAEVDEYVDSGEAMGKAGAYAIQETGDRFVREVRGSFSNVVGLPMEAVEEMLAEFEIRARK